MALLRVRRGQLLLESALRRSHADWRSGTSLVDDSDGVARDLSPLSGPPLPPPTTMTCLRADALHQSQQPAVADADRLHDAVDAVPQRVLRVLRPRPVP